MRTTLVIFVVLTLFGIATFATDLCHLHYNPPRVNCLTQNHENLDDPFIMYGKKAKPGQFPWQVAVEIFYHKHDKTGLCGGTLVKPNKVITAAHCVWDHHQNTMAKHISVEAGGINLYQLQQRTDVKEIFKDPHWESDFPYTTPYDYAELILEEPFKIVKDCVETIEPAGKEFREIAVESLNKCWASGWGETEHGCHTDLRYYEGSVAHRDTEFVTLVTKERRASPGKGDTGGPLVCEVDGTKYLFGATSEAGDGTPYSTFAEVSEFQ